jgi:hypothetical protein
MNLIYNLNDPIGLKIDLDKLNNIKSDLLFKNNLLIKDLYVINCLVYSFVSKIFGKI